MKLTGKCKEDFEEWYLKSSEILPYLSQFKKQSFSVRYKVYRVFFDSRATQKEIEIENETYNYEKTKE
tara:strand:- start:26 stop:229 length:204 start_codon:yes stop_codon:yes gene_type:complete